MSGTQKVQDPGDHARKYGAFQSEIYANGMFKGYVNWEVIYRHLGDDEPSD